MARVIAQRQRDVQAIELGDEQQIDCDTRSIQANRGARKLLFRKLSGTECRDGRWPGRTKVRCWYCRLPFSGTPVPVVQQYDSVRDLYTVYGMCCGAPCSKAFIIDLRSNDGLTRLMWQRRMLVDVFGWPADQPIPTAPPWQALKEFGGSMTAAEWRAAPYKLKMRLRKAPFVPFSIFTESEITGEAALVEAGVNSTGPGPARKRESLEQQATQHGASFSLKNLVRPPEHEVIKTNAQLRDRHPELAAAASAESEFQEFLDTQALPTEAECRTVREKREAERKASRKRKRSKTATSK
jgi:hypothetical protein